MRISVKYLIPLLVAATITSCSDLFNGGDDGPQLTLNASQVDGDTIVFNGDTLVFRPYGPSQGDSVDIKNLPPFQFSKDGQNILINGYFLALSGGWFPKGDIDRKNNSVIITVHPPDLSSRPSLDLGTGFLYQAFISNLDKGTYTVIIVHKGDGLYYNTDKELDTVFTETFEIE